MKHSIETQEEMRSQFWHAPQLWWEYQNEIFRLTERAAEKEPTRALQRKLEVGIEQWWKCQKSRYFICTPSLHYI